MEDDDDDPITGDTEREEDEQRPVGVLNDAVKAIDVTTYAGRKEAANRRIAALIGEKVTIKRRGTETLEWTVIKVKEGMREGEYCDTLGATAACTLQLTELALDGNSECGIMGDAWFGSVKAAVALSKKGYKSILPVKTGHGLFPKNFIDDTLKDAPGGVWIILESIHQQVPLLAIGYRYSTLTTLFFVATKDSGRTTNGNPYEMKYTDDLGNVHVRYVDRPEIISK
jgi:hypothetical protein